MRIVRFICKRHLNPLIELANLSEFDVNTLAPSQFHELEHCDLIHIEQNMTRVNTGDGGKRFRVGLAGLNQVTFRNTSPTDPARNRCFDLAKIEIKFRLFYSSGLYIICRSRLIPTCSSGVACLHDYYNTPHTSLL